jgi:hypothetical protein
LIALDRDQPIDDLTALDQQPMHALVDAVDLAAEVGEIERRWGGGQRDLLAGLSDAA